MTEIVKRYVPKEVQNSVTYKGRNQRKTLTVHQTGNPRKGANAEMHARLQENGNSRAASWTFQSDDKEIIQSFPLSARTWHAGDGMGEGNLNSISWEICINEDGDYVKSLEVAANGIAQVLKAEGLTVDDLRQHWDWSRKNCPAQIRAGKAGIGWNDFKNMVRAELNGKPKPKPQTNPKKSPQQVAEEIYRGQGDWGNNPGRREKLIARGYSYSEVQGLVNDLVKGKTVTPPRIEPGNLVRVKQSAERYATGEKIPNWVKTRTCTTQQTRTQNNVRQVLLREIVSWVKESDVTKV